MAGSVDDAICDLDRIERDLPELCARYRAATPFPHVVIDDFLSPDAFARAKDEFPGADGDWINYLHVNERKYGNVDLATWGPTLRAVAGQLMSERFLRIVAHLSGFEALHADESMDGGGLHRTQRGGHLNVHADFTAHHREPTWRRRVNVLLYLNDEWPPEWGGDLELWSPDMRRCEQRIAPLGNRVVIFTTDRRSYHGHPEPLACPAGVARRSLALYYFEEQTHPVTRSTDYRARPGDGAKAMAIYADKLALHAFDVARRRFGLSDQLASQVLERLGRRGRRGRLSGRDGTAQGR